MAPHDSTIDIKPRSRVVTDGIEATTSRGMLRAVGMGDEDWDKPQIGIASSWNEITPCNLSLDRLAQGAKEGVHSGGGYPLQFGTISVSDGISMGHEGMHFSLVSREVIADSVETVVMAERLDVLFQTRCDGNIGKADGVRGCGHHPYRRARAARGGAQRVRHDGAREPLEPHRRPQHAAERTATSILADETNGTFRATSEFRT